MLLHVITGGSHNGRLVDGVVLVLAKFIRDVAKKAGQHFNTSEEEPRIHRSQFAYKWKCRIVLAFMKTQAQQMLQLQRRIIRTKLRRNNIPIVYDELFL
mmetsp:Transcript_14792/g.16842  ORF Transcript_14792/g.16842 Transcript_14792/m.16842 type:complete len:99 (+) Transcript_14792:1390-1686(+)